MAADRNARIRERAYHLWLAEGRPQGRHEEHWRHAEREVIGEENNRSEAPPTIASQSGVEDVGAASRQDAAARHPPAGSRALEQPKADQPKAGQRARRSSPAPATDGSGSRGSRRPATAKPTR